MKNFSILFFLMSMILITCEAFASTSLTYDYDANGNLISGDGKYYEYNNANQLVKVKHGDQNGPVIAEYFYDYTGQRIKKIDNGVTTYYIGKHFETQTDGSNTQQTSYYFANGERVAKKDALGNIAYYHSDHLGGTNVITDSSGNLTERIKYYPFGEIREGGNEKYSFTGKEKDKQTDFYYFEARYYNPEFKHFTQADTVAPNLYDPQNLNRYANVLNNPIKLIDPSGHFSLSKWLKDTHETAKENVSSVVLWLGREIHNDIMFAGDSIFKRPSTTSTSNNVLQKSGGSRGSSKEHEKDRRNRVIDRTIDVTTNIGTDAVLSQVPGGKYGGKLYTAAKVGKATGQKMNEEFVNRGPIINHDLYDEDGEMQKRYITENGLTKGCVWASCYLTHQGAEIMGEGANAGGNEFVREITYGIVDLED